MFTEASASTLIATLDIQITTAIRSDFELTKSDLNTTLSPTGTEPCQFYMLRYHQDRLLAAAADFVWVEAFMMLDGSAGLQRLERTLRDHLHSTYGDYNYPHPLKLRLQISSTSQITTTSIPTPALPLSSLFPSSLSYPAQYGNPLIPPAWQIFICPCTTLPTLFTAHKTTHRTSYTHARDHLPPSSLCCPHSSEILLVNRDGQIMEGSIATPYFFRNEQWVTPCANHGGNVGTTRRWALEKGLCVEGEIPKSSVRCGEEVWVSNGVRGWGWGQVKHLDTDARSTFM